MTDRIPISFDEVIHETSEGIDNEGAFLIDIAGIRYWIPKSQSEITEPGIIEVEEWLAIEKELI